jgi:lipoate-protein ligase A
MPRTKKMVGVIETDKDMSKEDIKKTLFEALNAVFGEGGAMSQLSDQRREYEESKKKRLS